MLKDKFKSFPKILQEIGQFADLHETSVYVVGGYVRDMLLAGDSVMESRRDLDFTVVGDAIEFAKSLKQKFAAKNLVVYKRFGTAMLEVGEFKLEFVSAREESYAADSRKPMVKKADLKSDLSRRDFAINAIAVGLNSGDWLKLFDPFDGKADLQERIIRTPLDPEITFQDDPLRILRAIRFAAALRFHIDTATKAALKKMAQRLEIVSKERITDELFKILASAKPSIGFLLMDDLGVLPFVSPELVEMKGVEQRKGFHHKDVFRHTLTVVDNVAKVSDSLSLRLASLFHDVAKPRTKRFDEEAGWTFHGHDEIGARMMEGIARRMRISKEMKEFVQKLIRLHLRPIFLSSEEVTDSAIRRLIVQAGDDLDDLLKLCRADITSGNPRRVREHLKNFDFVMERVSEVVEKDKLRNFQSPVRGDKIMEICGIPPGPMVGKLKTAIEEAILDGKIANEYDAALAYLQQIKDDVLQTSGVAGPR
jgi:putative nucleotidyltransferase with HDIG domain